MKHRDVVLDILCGYLCGFCIFFAFLVMETHALQSHSAFAGRLAKSSMRVDLLPVDFCASGERGSHRQRDERVGGSTGRIAGTKTHRVLPVHDPQNLVLPETGDSTPMRNVCVVMRRTRLSFHGSVYSLSRGSVCL